MRLVTTRTKRNELKEKAELLEKENAALKMECLTAKRVAAEKAEAASVWRKRFYDEKMRNADLDAENKILKAKMSKIDEAVRSIFDAKEKK